MRRYFYVEGDGVCRYCCYIVMFMLSEMVCSAHSICYCCYVWVCAHTVENLLLNLNEIGSWHSRFFVCFLKCRIKKVGL